MVFFVLTAVGNNFHSMSSPLLMNNRPSPFSSLPFPMMIKPLMQSLPHELAYDFRTPLNSPRTSAASNGSHHTPQQKVNNNWSISDLLQSIGGLGRQKVSYYPLADNKDCPCKCVGGGGCFFTRFLRWINSEE